MHTFGRLGDSREREEESSTGEYELEIETITNSLRRPESHDRKTERSRRLEKFMNRTRPVILHIRSGLQSKTQCSIRSLTQQ